MTYLTLDDVLRIQADLIARSNGRAGVIDVRLIDSAVHQPQMTFGSTDLYPTLAEKAAALGYSLATNRGFIDGNKRIGHAAMETFLVLNGHEIDATVDDQEATFWHLADKKLTRDEFTAWVQARVVPLGTGGGGATNGP